MVLTFTGQRFETRFDYDVEVKNQVKAAGFMFDPKATVWWTTKLAVAGKLSQYADEAGKRALDELAAKPPLRLTWQNGRFELYFDYDPKLVAKAQEARFRWDRAAKCWWVKDAPTAERFGEWADETAKAKIIEGHEIIEASSAVNVDEDIPRPAGFEYLPYQVAGISLMKTRPVNFLGDEMGLGKTIQAIGLINADQSIDQVLVICPASLKRNWARELKKWLTREFEVKVIEGRTGATKISSGSHQVVVINYDIIGGLSKDIEWDLLVVDECHYLKGNSQRTTRILGCDKKGEEPEPGIKAKRKLWMTGTPIVNRPKELWNILHASDPATWSSFFAFAQRYCDATHNGWGWNFGGASNLEELQAKLRSTLLIRRLKKDVLKDLPAKRRQVVELELDKESRAAIAAEESAMEEKAEAIQSAQARVDVARLGDDEEEFKRALEALRSAYRVAFEEMARERHRVALAKVPAAIEWIDSQELDKVIVFAHHHDVIDRLKAHYGDAAVVLTGETANAKRQEAVDRFQTDEACKVFIGSIQAAGVGITLTAASHVVFVEIDWVPGNLSQCEDRAHRIGQDNAVNIYHLVLDKSLDARMAHILVEKQDWIDRLTDADKLQAVEPIRIDWKHEEPEQIEIRESVKKVTKKTSADPERRMFGYKVEDITVEQCAEVHRALRILAGMCDGAARKDDCGFNRCDTAIGHELAARVSLTKGQAVLGYKLIQKYHRQVTVGFKLKAE